MTNPNLNPSNNSKITKITNLEDNNDMVVDFGDSTFKVGDLYQESNQHLKNSGLRDIALGASQLSLSINTYLSDGVLFVLWAIAKSLSSEPCADSAIAKSDEI